MPRLVREICWTTLVSFAMAQTLAAQEPFQLQVYSHEVALNFHVVDEQGRSITDIAQSDLRLLDNGHPASRITLFVHHDHLPLRLAILFDESESMEGAIAPRRAAQLVAETAIHDARDQAMVLRFDFETQVQQDWTGDPHLLMQAAAHVTDLNGSRMGGTAIWDSLYRACRDHMPAQPATDATWANAILLFTDGVDNRSHALPQDVVDECQQRQTPIYAFVPDEKSRMNAGQKALRSIAELTGGGVFYQQGSAANFTAAILHIDEELRDQYTLVYRPAKLKRDHSFHSIQLECPRRTAFISVRSGYYATP
jgi:VWFA-related protein